MTAEASSSLNELRRLLESAEKDLSPSWEPAVEVARLLLEESRTRESSDEKSHKLRLGAILESPRLGLFGGALTDRAFRSNDERKTIAIARKLLDELQVVENSSFVEKLLLSLLDRLGPLVPGLARDALLERVRSEARPYVVNADESELSRFLTARAEEGFLVNLNYLGEEVLGEREAEKHLAYYDSLARLPNVFSLSVKLSGLTSRVSAISPEETMKAALPRLRRLARKVLDASRPAKLLYFDMEAYRDVEATIGIFEALAMDSTFDALPLGIALQAYLPESFEHAHLVDRIGRKRVARGGAEISLRLVKGANLAMERVTASRERLAVPVLPSKREVDENYIRILSSLFRSNEPGVILGVASHNIFDIALALLESRRSARKTHFEMLAGMAGPLGRTLVSLGKSVLLYAPAVHDENFPAAIAYLVRRLDEATAKENFLRSAFSMTSTSPTFDVEAERFRSACAELGEFSPAPTRRTTRIGEPVSLAAPTIFENAPDTDFTIPENRELLDRFLERVKGRREIVLPCIDGHDESGFEEPGFDPSRPLISAYSVHFSGKELVERAISSASRGSSIARATSAESRLELLERIANELERSRPELVATLVKDAGKRILEADLEVSEAVDFARYYAEAFRRLERDNHTTPLGVVVVTPPWNFPLAIPLGGVVAALVTGNAVILKPAPETPLVGRALFDCLRRARVPEETLHFLPVKDEFASPLIVDPRVDAVVLTGGTETARKFLRMRPNLRLLAETGGKNCAYVSALADRESAIQHVVQSAFGHAGQKCSALSVLVLEREVYEDEKFLEMLVDATESLVVGSAWDKASFVTPLIHPPRGSLAYALGELEFGESFLVRSRASDENPRLVSPAIRLGVHGTSRAHQDEFFGPHLALVRAEDLDDGIRLMNSTRYGLTAGFFSLDEREQTRFLREMDAGNLYVNRGITGAVVGRQPFGGRRGSAIGSGAKAGGPNYLYQFLREFTPRPRSEVQEDASGLRVRPLRHELSLEGFRAELRSTFTREFAGKIAGTAVLGEENYLVFEPRTVSLVVLEEADPLEVECAALAAETAGAPLTVFVPRGFELLGERSSARTYESFSEIARISRDFSTLRILGGPAPGELRKAELLEIDDRPLSRNPREELFRYLREKAVSRSNHRYGNLALGNLGESIAPEPHEASSSKRPPSDDAAA